MIWRVFSREGGASVMLFREGDAYAYMRGGRIPSECVPTTAFRTWNIFVCEEGSEAEWITAVLAERWDPEEYSRKEQN